MGAFTKVSRRMTRWIDAVDLLGQMAENTLVTTKMTKRKVTEYSLGLMVASTMVFG